MIWTILKMLMLMVGVTQKVLVVVVCWLVGWVGGWVGGGGGGDLFACHFGVRDTLKPQNARMTYPHENSHDEGTSIIWRCISYWTWWFSSGMLVFRGVHDIVFPFLGLTSLCPRWHHWWGKPASLDLSRTFQIILRFFVHIVLRKWQLIFNEMFRVKFIYIW